MLFRGGSTDFFTFSVGWRSGYSDPLALSVNLLGNLLCEATS